MLNIIGKKNWYFAFSLLTIIPGIIALFLWGLTLSIDFTGGSRMILLFPKSVNQQQVEHVKTVFQKEQVAIVTTQTSDKLVIVRTKPLNEKTECSITYQT